MQETAGSFFQFFAVFCCFSFVAGKFESLGSAVFRCLFLPLFFVFFCCFYQRFQKGVGGRGLATNKPPKTGRKSSPQMCPLLLKGHRKKVQKRGLNLWHRKDFFAPTPSVRQPLFETSDFSFFLRVAFKIFQRVPLIRNALVTPAPHIQGNGAPLNRNQGLF